MTKQEYEEMVKLCKKYNYVPIYKGHYDTMYKTMQKVYPEFLRCYSIKKPEEIYEV